MHGESGESIEAEDCTKQTLAGNSSWICTVAQLRCIMCAYNVCPMGRRFIVIVFRRQVI